MLPLVRLLQLASPALPVGAYTYSQGLEWAVEAGAIRDEADTLAWIGDALEWNVARFEAPLLAALIDAWSRGDRGDYGDPAPGRPVMTIARAVSTTGRGAGVSSQIGGAGQTGAQGGERVGPVDAGADADADADAEVVELNQIFVASRETSELRAETVQMGYSLVRLLCDLDAFSILPGWRARLDALVEPAFPTAWSAAAAAWRIPVDQAMVAYLWAWLENQVMAAVKAVPLGQSAGQRLLAELGARVPALVEEARGLPSPTGTTLPPASRSRAAGTRLNTRDFSDHDDTFPTASGRHWRAGRLRQDRLDPGAVPGAA